MITKDDYVYHVPTNRYIFTPTGEACLVTGVNARLGKMGKVMASKWIRLNNPVDQVTWAPGKPQFIEDMVITKGGWTEKRGAIVLNTYQPPVIARGGDPQAAGLWLDLAGDLFGNWADHLIDYMAFKVQHPDRKPNHGITLGSGAQGIGKDTLLEGWRYAIGPHNWQDSSPSKMTSSNFNGYLESVVFRVNEVHDLGDQTRVQFYDRMKDAMASPPTTLRIDKKYIPDYLIPNICGVVMTTNHKTDGLYLPESDRRNFVVWCDLKPSDFPENYCTRMWDWYKKDNGFAHVAALLQTWDLSKFDAEAPPPKTEVFYEIVTANKTPNEAEIADVLDELGMRADGSIVWPDVIVSEQLRNAAAAKGTFLRQRKQRRRIPIYMESAGYVPVRNGSAKDGLWKIGGKRQVVYARDNLTIKEQMQLAAVLTGEAPAAAQPPPHGSNGGQRGTYRGGIGQ
jgi:hypothetical protein